MYLSIVSIFLTHHFIQSRESCAKVFSSITSSDMILTLLSVFRPSLHHKSNNMITHHLLLALIFPHSTHVMLSSLVPGEHIPHVTLLLPNFVAFHIVGSHPSTAITSEYTSDRSLHYPSCSFGLNNFNQNAHRFHLFLNKADNIGI